MSFPHDGPFIPTGDIGARTIWCRSSLTLSVVRIETDGHANQVIAALMPVIEQTVARALTTDIDAIGNFTPAADLCMLEHETAQQRIYRT